MTQTAVLRELVNVELTKMKKDPRVKKVLFLKKKMNTSNPLTERGKRTITSLRKEFKELKHDEYVKKALVLHSCI